MVTLPIRSTDVFGVYDSKSEDAYPDDAPYQVSRTGIIIYPVHNTGGVRKPQVISMVNGSMCINPLDEFICAANFDEHLLNLVAAPNKYRFSREDEPGLAYFDPDTNTYTAVEPEWHRLAAW